MYRWFVWVGIILIGLGVTRSCGQEQRPKHSSIATESVYEGMRVQLSANTNCIEVGAPLVVTMRLSNEGSQPVHLPMTQRVELIRGVQPITLTNQQPFEIVIASKHNPALFQRWSHTDQYPHIDNFVVAPGETRTYEWQWVVPAAYGHGAEPRFNGVFVEHFAAAVFGSGEVVQPLSGNILDIGVEFYTEGNLIVRCSELRQ